MEITTEYTQPCLVNPSIRRLCLVQPSPFFSLPPEILGEIFRFLDNGRHLVYLAQVCKSFRDYIYSHEWQVYILKIKNLSSLSSYSGVVNRFCPVNIHLINFDESLLRSIPRNFFKEVTINGGNAIGYSKFLANKQFIRQFRNAEKFTFIDVVVRGPHFILPSMCRAVKFVNVRIDYALIMKLNQYKLIHVHFENCIFNGKTLENTKLLNCSFTIVSDE